MSTQPEALQLADWARSYNTTMHNRCAAELRRLHAEVEELRGALDEAMWHVKYKELKAVNEELLEALRWIATVNAMDYEYQQKARAAIAKAGGEA